MMTSMRIRWLAAAAAVFALGLGLGLALAAPARAGSAEVNKALKAAKQAVIDGDAGKLEKELAILVAEDGRTAARGLLGMIEKIPTDGRERLYWQVVGAVAVLKDHQALGVVGDWLVDNAKKPYSRDVLFSMQSNRSEGVIEVYARLLKKAKVDEIRLMAVDRLGELGRPDAIDLLLEVYEKEDRSGSALERRIKMTLTGLFGEDMGDFVNFKGYWDRNRDKGLGGGGGDTTTTGTVKDELDKARAGGLATVTRDGGGVLVLSGKHENFDHIEKMLERLGVPHDVKQKEEFAKDMDKMLEGVSAVILNCNFIGQLCTCPTCKPGEDPNSRLPVCTGCDKHELSTDALPDDAVARLKKFVADGGSVFTEDWGLTELTSKAWPDYLKKGQDLGDQQVDYAPVPGQTGNALLRGVFARPGGEGGATTTFSAVDNRWKVDNLSPAIEVVAKGKVTVLLESQDLKKSASGHNAVAVTFSPDPSDDGSEGDGKRVRTGRRKKGEPEERAGIVLHVLSHFGKQGSQEDEFTLQNLLVNFLLEANDRWAARR